MAVLKEIDFPDHHDHDPPAANTIRVQRRNSDEHIFSISIFNFNTIKKCKGETVKSIFFQFQTLTLACAALPQPLAISHGIF